MSKVTPEIVHRRIEYFTKRFGKGHLYLAYHAAFPLALKPDLLYSLWANFQQDIHGKVLGIPWIAVADILLSSLCDEVGYELYEMDVAVRKELLRGLQSDERFGKQRINQLSDFLLEYVREQLRSDDPEIQDFAKTQQWIALAYTQPSKAARELALAFSKLEQQESAELLRMASLTETFAEPLVGFQPLLIYARGMGKFARGNLEAAKAEFGKVLKGAKDIQVAEVNLPVPEQIHRNQTGAANISSIISRKQFLRWVGFGGVGLVTALVTREFSQTLPIPTPTLAPIPTPPTNNDVTLEMVKIPGGTFIMGSPEGENGRDSNESPQYQVNVPTFFMSKFEITQEQYQQVMGENPSYFKGYKHPVENVSWNDAVEFCRRLSLETGRNYRLPTEAEWEYAARAGTTTPFYSGEIITSNLANYGNNNKGTTEVGTFPPNAFGLYDMHGNVFEWVQDHSHENYIGAPTDGSAWIGNSKDPSRRVARGGSWLHSSDIARSARRGWWHRYNKTHHSGFRVALDGVAT